MVARQTIRLVISLSPFVNRAPSAMELLPSLTRRERKSGGRAFVRLRRIRMTEFAIKNYYFYRQVDVTSHVVLVSCTSVSKGGQVESAFSGMNYKVEPAARMFLE
jgi:hypothetical protein